MFNLGVDFTHISSVFSIFAAPAADPLIWNLFLFFLFLGSILAAVIMYLSSKTPDEWQHQSAIDKPPLPGRLKLLSHQLQQTIDNGYNAPIMKKSLQNIFLEKVRMSYGLTSSDVLFFHEKDRHHLQNLIHDNVLYSWLFLQQPLSLTDLGVREKKMRKKQRRFVELQQIIKRMEEWEA